MLGASEEELAGALIAARRRCSAFPLTLKRSFGRIGITLESREAIGSDS